jgi:hypothetical protein
VICGLKSTRRPDFWQPAEAEFWASFGQVLGRFWAGRINELSLGKLFLPVGIPTGGNELLLGNLILYVGICGRLVNRRG